MIYLGIDPGLAGGIAALHADGNIVAMWKMPATPREVLDTFDSLVASFRSVRAVLEHVSASPQMGTVSAFTFGKGFGGLVMALTAARVPFEEVAPSKWQLVMQCRTKGDKNVSKHRAQALFPGVAVTHAIADALLIAEYCRRLEVRT
jgi:Holliday junction resolvasome RuvABC endonuclease subunit